ncbi:hypothetical protein [Cohnella caldifontis]|uniref:hypothetical protein n=1 Tax=Cohnella caldifontis TaxID=3027471 RepID=UPI0023EAE3B8|nr:hypothetical protein [Cohnella sp. YIM B05605]
MIITTRFPAIESMPEKPQAVPPDWNRIGKRFKQYVLNPENRVMFVNGMGNSHFAAFHDGTGEELITLGGVVLGGIFQREDVSLYLKSLRDFYHPDHKMFFNRPKGAPQAEMMEYWYLMFVNALAAGIVKRKAEEEPELVPLLKSSMDGLVKMAHQIQYDFNDQGFDFDHGVPFTRQDQFRQPDSVGGYAYLMVFAYEMFGDSRYLTEARIAMDRYLAFPENPWYEMPNGAMACHAAARLNRLGGNYDIGKAVSHVFDPVKGPLHVGTWGDKEVSGLMRGWFGNLDESERKIAYSLETLVLLPYLLPVLKEAPDLAGPVGKYALHAASNAQWFIADLMPAESQSTPHFTPDVPYENLIHQAEGPSPYASGDFFGHRSVYGGAMTIWWDAMMDRSEDPYILQWDLDVTDFLGVEGPGTRHRLIYNPHGEERTVQVALPDGAPCRGEDLGSKTRLFERAEGSAEVRVPPKTGIVLKMERIA